MQNWNLVMRYAEGIKIREWKKMRIQRSTEAVEKTR